MVSRILVGVGLFLLGYYVGREVGRTEPVREHLRQVRARKQDQDAQAVREN